MHRAAATLLFAAAVASGCGYTGPANPGWTLSEAETLDRLKALRDDPIAPERPIVYVGGYGLPRAMVAGEARGYTRGITDDYHNDVVVVGLAGHQTMEQAVEDLIRTVNAKWERTPEQIEAGETVEVDVIGMSAGGIVARLANLPDPHARRDRLKIRRLVTLASPHRGAMLAERTSNTYLVDDLRPRSLLLTKLHEALPEAEYELVPYGIASDDIVGLQNSAPWGHTPIWTQGRRVLSHIRAQDDNRLRLDVALVLRGEQPILERGVPLPEAD